MSCVDHYRGTCKQANASCGPSVHSGPTVASAATRSAHAAKALKRRRGCCEGESGGVP
jgi:hypothetical protein